MDSLECRILNYYVYQEEGDVLDVDVEVAA